jgi:small-conductance mechanosensitive channel
VSPFNTPSCIQQLILPRKHPYDVGDRVDIDKGSYIVKEMRLLSTIFLDTSRGCLVQAPNAGLSTQVSSDWAYSNGVTYAYMLVYIQYTTQSGHV